MPSKTPTAVARREFVKAAAGTAAGAAVAAPWILTHAASARSTRANEAVGIGIIGMGIRGRNLMRGYLLGNDRVAIRALCEVDTTRREHYLAEVHEKTGDSACESLVDYHDMLARDDIDAVIIATPDHWHATMSMHAAEAGKDIYCEKPLTHTLEESRRIIAKVRAHGRVFQTGSQQRSEYGHRFVRAAEQVRNGRIGKVFNVNIGVGDPPIDCELPAEPVEPGLDWDRWLGPTRLRPYHSELSPRGVHNHYPTWRAYWDYCNGYLADMGAHHYDIAQWALKADDAGPVRVAPPEDGHPTRGATLYYPSGVTVTHGGPGGCTFVGESGVIMVDRGRIDAMPASLLEGDLPEDAERLPRHPNHMENWLDCIHSRETPVAGVEAGARTAMVNQLVVLAYRLGREFEWDPHHWRFVGDDQPNAWLDYDRRDAYPLPEA